MVGHWNAWFDGMIYMKSPEGYPLATYLQSMLQQVTMMGLGYMEYFQLAEDLNAAPVPVMACGVLCQARSDYAHPAGGSASRLHVPVTAP